MIALKMSGYQISNLGRLQRHFSAVDLLLQREAFASFAQAHLKLNTMRRYHAKVFQAVVAQISQGSFPQDALENNDYWQNPLCLEVAEVAVQALISALSEYCADSKDVAIAQECAVADQLYELVLQTELNGTQQRALFYLVTAGYLLAGVTPQTRPVSAGELANAFLGQKQLTMLQEAQADCWVDLTSPNDELRLPARRMSYRLPLYTSPQLAADERIRTMRLTAARPVSGGRYLTVRLELYRTLAAEQPEQSLILKPGEFIFCNIVGDKVVKILETSVINGGSCLARQDLSQDTLHYFLENGSTQRLAAVYSRDASSFAVERSRPGFLIVQKNRINTGQYSNRRAYPQFSSLEYRQVVEVKIIDEDYLVLQDNGRVYSSNSAWDQLRALPTLERIILQ